MNSNDWRQIKPNANIQPMMSDHSYIKNSERSRRVSIRASVSSAQAELPYQSCGGGMVIW
jgi:hypothetical protein